MNPQSEQKHRHSGSFLLLDILLWGSCLCTWTLSSILYILPALPVFHIPARLVIHNTTFFTKFNYDLYSSFIKLCCAVSYHFENWYLSITAGDAVDLLSATGTDSTSTTAEAMPRIQCTPTLPVPVPVPSIPTLPVPVPVPSIPTLPVPVPVSQFFDKSAWCKRCKIIYPVK